MPHSHCTREIACDHRDFSQSFWQKRCACAGDAFNMWIGAYSTACPSEGMAMKKSSFLVMCMILLNGLGCGLVPTMASAAVRRGWRGEAAVRILSRWSTNYSLQ